MDYDKLGHCCLCHKNLMTQKFYDNAWHNVFAEREEVEYTLSDNSTMRVTLCKSCKDTITDKDNDKIMKSVVKGWQKEVDNFNHWNEDKKITHMKKYGSLKIKELNNGVNNKTKHI